MGVCQELYLPERQTPEHQWNVPPHSKKDCQDRKYSFSWQIEGGTHLPFNQTNLDIYIQKWRMFNIIMYVMQQLYRQPNTWIQSMICDIYEPNY